MERNFPSSRSTIGKLALAGERVGREGNVEPEEPEGVAIAEDVPFGFRAEGRPAVGPAEVAGGGGAGQEGDGPVGASVGETRIGGTAAGRCPAAATAAARARATSRSGVESRRPLGGLQLGQRPRRVARPGGDQCRAEPGLGVGRVEGLGARPGVGRLAGAGPAAPSPRRGRGGPAPGSA